MTKPPMENRSQTTLDFPAASSSTLPTSEELRLCLDEYVQRIRPGLLRFGSNRRLLPEIAEDAVGDAVVRALEYIDSGEAARHPNRRGWLTLAVRGAIRNAPRHERQFASLEQAEAEHSRRAHLRTDETQQAMLDEIWGAFRLLPVEDQDLLAFCVLQEHSYAEAAAHFRVTEDAVRGRLFRAKECLGDFAMLLFAANGIVEAVFSE